jgi:hypothetical protein
MHAGTADETVCLRASNANPAAPVAAPKLTLHTFGTRCLLQQHAAAASGPIASSPLHAPSSCQSINALIRAAAKGIIAMGWGARYSGHTLVPVIALSPRMLAQCSRGEGASRASLPMQSPRCAGRPPHIHCRHSPHLANDVQNGDEGDVAQAQPNNGHLDGGPQSTPSESGRAHVPAHAGGGCLACLFPSAGQPLSPARSSTRDCHRCRSS